MISSVNSVSSVNFKAAMPQDPISRPGRFTVAPKETAPGEKKHKALKWIVGLAAAAVAAGALLVVGKNRNWFKVLDSADALKNAPIIDKCKHYLGKAADFVDTHCWQKLKDAPAKIADWWKNRGAAATEEAAEVV